MKPLISLSILAGCVLASALPALAAPGDWTGALKSLDYSSEGGGLKNQILAEMREDGFSASWEDPLIDVVGDGTASLDGRRLACELLGFFITPGSISSLAPMLADPGLGHDVRIALADLRGAGVDEAFLAALDGSRGRVASELIAVIADRRIASAATALMERFQQDPDASVALQSLRAIGRIGGPGPVEFLSEWATFEELPNSIQIVQQQALLKALESSVEMIAYEQRSAIAQRLFQQPANASVRAAAAVELARLTPANYQFVVQLLASSDPAERELGAVCLRVMEWGPQARQVIRGTLPALSSHATQLLLHNLAEIGAPLALDLARSLRVSRSIDEDTLAVVHEVIAQMGAAEDGKDLFAAIVGDEDPKGFAASAIARIPDPELNAWLVGAFGTASSEAAQQAAADAIAARGMADAIPLLYAEIDTAPMGVRRAIYRAIGDIGDPGLGADLLERRAQVESTERGYLDRAIVDLARRETDGGLSGLLIAAYGDAEGELKDRYLRMIGAVENDTTLALLEELISKEDPNPIAIRGILSWRSPDLIDAIQPLVEREEVPGQYRQMAWDAMLRLTKTAIRDWHEDRWEFWERCEATALDESAIREMFAAALELNREEAIPWLEKYENHPELGDAAAETKALLKMQLGL